MEQRNERYRGPKSTAADGSDLSLAQAELWLSVGSALAGVLRRMLGRGGYQRAAEEEMDAVTDGEAGSRPGSDQEAA